ncbi:MAG: hypothetical protein MI923_20325 [Phycisphaerales bacterium]|nr:hypothetical protein [Phycisphaerales bacterium]
MAGHYGVALRIIIFFLHSPARSFVYGMKAATAPEIQKDGLTAPRASCDPALSLRSAWGLLFRAEQLDAVIIERQLRFRSWMDWRSV